MKLSNSNTVLVGLLSIFLFFVECSNQSFLSKSDMELDDSLSLSNWRRQVNISDTVFTNSFELDSSKYPPGYFEVFPFTLSTNERERELYANFKTIPPPKTENEPFIERDRTPYRIKGDSLIVANCDNFDRFRLESGYENFISSEDTNFMKCFIKHFSTINESVTVKQIETLIEKFEADYKKHQTIHQKEIYLESELEKPYAYNFQGDEVLTVKHLTPIEIPISNIIKDCEKLWVLRDTNAALEKQNLLFSWFNEDLSYFPDIETEVNLFTVVGYYIFVRYKNKNIAQKINDKLFVTLQKISPDSSLSGATHTLLHTFARYNLSLYFKTIDPYYFSMAYSLYQYSLFSHESCPYKKEKCNTLFELANMVMYSNKDIELRYSALELFNSIYVEGKQKDDWIALKSEFNIHFASYHVESGNTEPFKRHQTVAANSLLNVYNKKISKISVSNLNGVLGSIMGQKELNDKAFFYWYLSLNQLSQIDYDFRIERNYKLTILNIPWYLYKMGRKAEALHFFEFCINKSFCSENLGFMENLQMQYNLLAGDGEKTLAKEVCNRMLDSAKSLNSKNIASQAYQNLAELAKAENDQNLFNTYKNLSNSNYEYKSYQNPYLVRDIDVINERLRFLPYVDSVKQLELILQKTNRDIEIQRTKIKQLINESSHLSVSLKKSSDSLLKSRASIEALDAVIKGKIETIGTLQYLDSTKNLAIAEKDKALLEKNKALIAEKNARYIAYGITAVLFLAVVLVIWISLKFHKEKIRSNASEANQRILSRTMYQLGHLGPQCINNLITSFEKEIVVDKHKVASRLDSLSELLRKFYDYSKMNFITYREEYDLACDYVDIAFERQGQTILPSDLIKSNYKDVPDIKMPTFVAFNAIQNAFKHGKIANYSTSTTEVLLNVHLDNYDNSWSMRIENKKLSKKVSTRVGGGLNFIEEALKYWNGGQKNKNSSIEETEEMFALNYNFISKQNEI